MNNYKNISVQVIKRLPRYYRFLGDLLENGIVRTSSRDLSNKMGLTASQIRQDLNCFGGFGQQGYGYSVQSLHKEIGNILGLNSRHPIILIGAGNLGKAVALSIPFEKRGFVLTGIFDNDSEKAGVKLDGVEIRDTSEIEDFCHKNNPEAAILCIPKPAAPELADRLYNSGVKCFWNFSHYDLSVKYDDAIVENVHLNDSLMILCYKMSEKKNNETE